MRNLINGKVKEEGIDECVIFNRSGVFAFEKHTVSAGLKSFQTSKGVVTSPGYIRFEYTLDQDPDSSGLAEDFKIIVPVKNGDNLTIDLDEVKPEQLFWLGKLFMDTAEYLGTTEKTVIKEEKASQSKKK